MRTAPTIIRVSLMGVSTVLLGLILLVQGCSDTVAPGPEVVESLELSAPSTIVAGESFSLTVRAVGSDGTRPFESVDGEVTLTASVGTISPGTATLVDGEATVSVTLSAADGVVRVTADHAQASGTKDLTVAGLRSLPGDAADNAAASIPDLDYAASQEDFRDGHPDLPDLSVSFNTILVNFTTDATVNDANDLIESIGGVIVGGIRGASSGKGGMLMLRVPTSDHAAMDDLIADLEAESAVQFVGRDIAIELTAVPNSADSPAPGWTWESEPAGGNWGMEMCRMPQMWNLNSAIAKRGNPTTLTGIFDGGFGLHNDLAFHRVMGRGSHEHGTHVAGTIAAGFNNKRGVDGVSPFAQLRVASPLGMLSSGAINDGIEALAAAGCRVINLSLGWDWETTHPDNAPLKRASLVVAAHRFVWMLDGIRDEGTVPLFVVSAGNDSDDHSTPVEARWNSPYAYAALELDEKDIIVVEAIELEEGGRRLEMSNPGGHVSAPGGAILSTIPNNGFDLFNGTSMATPHVTGLASFLLSIDPSLTNEELIELITSNTQPTVSNKGVGASPRIDGFAAALAIDGLRNNDTMVRMLVDIDDGTIDGNLRVRPDNPSVDFIGEDADRDNGIGDGRVDMSDFRRWRDWFHQLDQTPGVELDGSANHPKRDVNGNGKVENAGAESVFPRADFNGDGSLDIAAKSIVPGDIAFAQSDFEVIARYFDDEAFQENVLEQLIFSGDVYVDLTTYFDGKNFDQVVSQAVTTSGDVIETHGHTASGPAYVYTLEFDQSYQVTAWGISNGDTLCEHTETFAVALCGDRYWSPVCDGGPAPGICRAGNAVPAVRTRRIRDHGRRHDIRSRYTDRLPARRRNGQSDEHGDR